MTDTATRPDAVDRYLQLDEPTAAVVAAAFGQDPTTGDVDTDRLDGIITAVTAGREQAAEMTRDARPITPDEAAAPELPADVPVDTSHLRARIRDMDDESRALFLAAWQASGLPTTLADTDGGSILLDRATHHAVEALIAQHEPLPDPRDHAYALEHLDGLPAGPRFVIVDELRANGIADCRRGDTMTTGRLRTFEAILYRIAAEATTEVADALGPVVEGRIVTSPVADAAALVEVVPDGKVSDVLDWVGDDATRAGRALDAERARAKPRASLVSKLAQVAGEPMLPPSGSPSPAEPLLAVTTDPAEMPGQLTIVAAGGAPRSGPLPPDLVEQPPAAALTAVEGRALDGAPPGGLPVDTLALADRLVSLADELYRVALTLTGGEG